MNSSELITTCVVPSRHGYVVVTLLFVNAFFATDPKTAVGLLLIGAVPTLGPGSSASCDLREVTVATRAVRALTKRPRE
jgi:hypothetical protein